MKGLQLYLSPEAEAKLRELAEKEKRDASRQLLVIIEYYEKNRD